MIIREVIIRKHAITSRQFVIFFRSMFIKFKPIARNIWRQDSDLGKTKKRIDYDSNSEDSTIRLKINIPGE